MKFYLVRHGETKLNKSGVVQGWCDSDLTEDGIKQANQLGEALKDIPFFKAYSGDLSRQCRTAEAIMEHNVASNTKVIRTRQLREMNFGQFEGRNYFQMMKTYFDCKGIEVNNVQDIFAKADIYDAYNYLYEYDDKNTVENPVKIFERMMSVIDRAANESDKNILIVTSGAALVCLFKNLFAGKEENYNFPNCSVSIIEYKNGRYNLLQKAKRLFVE